MTRRKVLAGVLAFMAGIAFNVTGKSKYHLRIVSYRCVGCRDCYRVCPIDTAIVMQRGKAVIKQGDCTCCMRCESVCTYGAVERCEPCEN